MEELMKLAREGNVGLEDFDRFARHQAGQEYLMALVAMRNFQERPALTPA